MVFRRFQSLIAACLLLAYTASGTQFLPGLVSLLALCEGSHELLVNRTEDGPRLILHHRSNEFTPKSADHRNPMARVLTAFCSVNGEGDHCLSSRQLAQGARPGDELNVAKTSACESVINERATVEWLAALMLPTPCLEKLALLISGPCPDSQVERLTTVQLLV